jgi:isochorismate synthase
VQTYQYGAAKKESVMDQLIDKLARHFEANLPFAVYNKPNSDKLIGIFQHDDSLHFVADYNEIGFVLAPFSGDKLILIPQGESEILIEDFKAEATTLNDPASLDSQSGISKSDYESLIHKAIETIRSGAFGKVVLSRTEIVKLPKFDLKTVFKKLLDSYPTAFTYCFFHPKVGLWLGGFSEQLLQVKSNEFRTMAVAGTQPFHEGQPIWGDKEKAEQQFVTDFIVDNLKNQSAGIDVSKPYTMRAGNVMHIKTDIHGTLKSNSGLKEMLEILHPTPAVCGFPKDIAREFILENEGYDRDYYSGFLGEFNKDFAANSNGTDLYVNLRCLQIKGNDAILYIGGGVTKDSIPENEWQETANKSLTMKRILA